MEEERRLKKEVEDEMEIGKEEWEVGEERKGEKGEENRGGEMRKVMVEEAGM